MVVAVASPSELVLRVNERSRFRPAARASSEKRAAYRYLSAVASRLERTASYQVSLRRVLECAEQFQRTLDPAQRARWLALEDALFEHAWRQNQAYFLAGVDFARDLEETRGGKRGRKSRSAEREERPRGARRSATRIRDEELVALLAAALRRVAEHWEARGR